jgi:hypothetical protein
METEFTIQPDQLIVDKLYNNEYNISTITNEELIYCIMLLNMHIMIFEQLFEGEDMSAQIDYLDGTKFKSNEQDLLISAQNAKIIYPMLNKMKEECMIRTTNDVDLRNNIEQIYQDSVTFLFFIACI